MTSDKNGILTNPKQAAFYQDSSGQELAAGEISKNDRFRFRCLAYGSKKTVSVSTSELA